MDPDFNKTGKAYRMEMAYSFDLCWFWTGTSVVRENVLRLLLSEGLGYRAFLCRKASGVEA